MQEERAADLIIRSEIDGVVTSWDVEKTLHARPIMTGQVMMEVADLTQGYFLDLELPEKREGHLDEFVADKQGKDLDVTYILASDPDDAPLEATLEPESACLGPRRNA